MISISSFSEAQITFEDGEHLLTMRPLNVKDASKIKDAITESIVNLLPFMDWAHGDLSIENQINRIHSSNQNFLQGIEYDFSVFDSSGEFLMSASLHPSKTRNAKAFEIGYWTRAKHCNRGLATLISKILTVVAFDLLKCDRLEIGCNKANVQSKRVIEKCGFHFEGEIRNYFSEPTPSMLRNNYSPERTYLSYTLTKDDLSNLTWYSEVKEFTQIA